MSEKLRLIELLKTQRENYLKLQKVSRRFAEKSQDSQNTTKLMELLSTREKHFEAIQASDKQISEILSGQGGERLLEDAAAKALTGQIMEIVETVIKENESAQKILDEARSAILAEFGSINQGRKTASKYGNVSRPVFAKFIDLKH